MTYDLEKYEALRSARVPHKLALSLASDALPNIGQNPDQLAGDLIEHISANPSPGENRDKINEIIDRLNAVIEYNQS
jgi:hypothetical protein